MQQGGNARTGRDNQSPQAGDASEDHAPISGGTLALLAISLTHHTTRPHDNSFSPCLANSTAAAAGGLIRQAFVV